MKFTLRRLAGPLLRDHCRIALAGFACLAASVAASHAQTGTVSGAVANAATRQFLNEAEVRVAGTGTSVLTDRDGTYTLRNVPAGPLQIEVSYTGLDPERRTVVVPANGTVQADFNLTAGIYKMDAFVVASEVEGNAAEINKQKKADIFMESISADSLGTVQDGNIGEFLRYMPGLQVNYSNADASTVSMRGQDPDATLVTFDGQIPAASGTAPRSSTGSSDASSRAFEFTESTINNIESIEIYKAPPPWMAPAAGGVINAVTKNAFTQRGRRLQLTFSLGANSEMLRWEIPGPGARTTERIKPGGSLSYSEAFLHNTLGISISYSETNSINPSHNYAMGYSPWTAGTAAAPVTDASPLNVNTFTLVDGPQAKARRNLGINTDYRLGPHTTLKLGVSYNRYLGQNRSHTFRVRPITTGTSRSTIDPSSTDTHAIIRNAQVDVFDDYSDDFRQNYGVVAGVEHRLGLWKINYSGSYSKADSKVSDLPAMIQSLQYNLIPASGVTVDLTARPDVPAPITLTQTAGPDLYDLHSYDSRTSFSLQTSPRFQNDRTLNLRADVIRQFPDLRFPFDVRVGTSLYQLHRRKMAGQIVLNYVGPDGIANTADDPVLNASLFNDTTYGDKFLYGIRKPPLLDPYKFADFMKANPGAVQDIQGTNVQRQIVNTQQMAQDVTAAYVASTVKLTSKATLMGGVRVEETENFVRGAVRKNSLGAPVLAAGFSNTSKEYFRAIYAQSERATSKYTDYFPNLQGTYRFTQDVILRASVSRSMKRPDVQTILPSTTVNDTAAQPSVSVNNAGLLPSYSRNYDVGLEIYTRPAGKIELGWFQKTITNYIINEQTVIGAGADNGFDGLYENYLLNTQSNGGKGEFKGFEASVAQSFRPYLKALPEIFRGWEIRGSYTYQYKAEAPNRSGVLITPLAPNFNKTNSSIGLTYMTPARTFYINVRTSWVPRAVRTLATTTDLRPVYEARHQRWDATARWRFNRSYAVELGAANLTNDSFLETWQGGHLTSKRTFGTNYTLTFIANLDDMRIPLVDR